VHARNLALAAALACSTLAPARSPARDGPGRPVGFTVSADLGGGAEVGRVGSTGLGEMELTAGYHVGRGFSPELSLALGLSPGTYLAVRPGLHYAFSETPFYLRVAFDAASPGGTMRWRWLLAGGGVELRLTDVVGGFAEIDLGLPISPSSGAPFLARAGIFLSF
jgi:hypothetical protein